MNEMQELKTAERPQLNLFDIPLVFAIGILSFVFHELAHGLCGKLLGYDMYVGINRAGLASGEYSQEWHNQLVSAAGPLFTIFIAIVGLALIRQFNWVRVLPIVFFSAMMRAIATLVSVSHPNDEARVSEWLGIGKWTLPFLVPLFLGWLVFLAAERLKLNWKSWALVFIVSSLAVTTVVLTEAYWPKINI